MRKLIIFLAFILLIVGVSAYDYYPGRNINLEGEWNMTNGSVANFQSLNVQDFSFTGNLTVAEKITFTLGEIIDNILDGWIKITGNLNVTQNITAQNLNGNLSWTNLNNYLVACPAGTYVTQIGIFEK